MAEIAPLLSPRGKSQALPKTRQVLVTDTAGVMRAIHAVIESMPEPEKPANAPPEKPQLVVYPLKSADPDAAVKVLEALMPEARFVRDPQANQISAYATPTQQAAVKSVIDQMQTTTPETGERARFEVYQLDGIDPKESLATLQPLVPAARLGIDPVSKKLAAWGTPADHEILKKAVEQLGAGTAGVDDRQVEVYRLVKADPASAMAVLANVVPRARLAVDAPTRSIVAVAGLDDQKTIRATLEQIESPKPTAGEPRKLVLYPVSAAERKRFNAVMSELSAEFPSVKIVTDAEPGELAVWADDAQHKVIAGIIEQVKQQPAAEDGYRLVAYPIRSADPASVLSVLQTMFPSTKLVPDARSRRIVAYTRAEEHEQIKSLIDQMDSDDAAGWQNQLMVYPVVGFEPTAAMTTLRSLAPEATLTHDTKANTIVVWARKSDQDQIAQALERMKPELDAAERPRVVSYSVGAADPSALYSLISALVPTARVVPNVANGTIAVWATPEDHVTIAGAIEEMAVKGTAEDAAKTVVYTLQHAEASGVASALQTAVPQARIAAAPNARKLVVWARPIDHETIRQTLTELDIDELPSGVVLKAYPIASGDGGTLLNTLQGLFARQTEVRLSLDRDNHKIVAMATPGEHEAIQRVIDEIQSGSLDETAEFRVHSLGNADPSMVRQVLRDVIDKDSRAVVSVDSETRQLAAVAPPELQQKIGAMLEQMQGAGRRLEVFELELVEPSAAEVAIQKLFAQGGRGRRAGEAPSVQADGMSSRLYVCAGDDELAEIRDLLVKMGETHLARSDRSGSSLRIIPYAGDTRTLVEAIERVWPRLSKHPLRVISSPATGEERLSPLPAPRVLEPAEPPADEKQPAKLPEKQTSHSTARGGTKVLTAAYQQQAPADEEKPPPAEKPADETAPQAKEPAPIIVSPGDGQITIMSDDPEAIKQFEALLRALSPPSGAGGRDVTVYPLSSANSSTVAELLKRIFRSGAFDFGDSATPVVEADQRLNAVVVYAGRNDRAIIERLLKQLDTEEVPDSLAANRPMLIPVEHTDAANIEGVLREVYQTQLTSGAPNPPIPIPSNASRDVAAVIQQINTAASGPLMTLGVDESTNGIVVMAPGRWRAKWPIWWPSWTKRR